MISFKLVYLRKTHRTLIVFIKNISDQRDTIIPASLECIDGNKAQNRRAAMMNRQLLAGICLSLIFLGVLGCYPGPQRTLAEKESIKQTIEGYYAQSLDMWMNLTMGDLSEYLDLESAQTYNKTIVLEELIERWKHALKRGYTEDRREKHKIYFRFDSIEITDDTAEVKVVLTGETSGMPTYPLFVNFGENTYRLRRIDDRWLIYEHTYISKFLYERSKTEKLELDIEKIQQEVDKEHRGF